MSFLCTALQLNEIYLPMKFHVDGLHSFKVMLRTDGRTSRLLYATLWGHKQSLYDATPLTPPSALAELHFQM